MTEVAPLHVARVNKMLSRTVFRQIFAGTWEFLHSCYVLKVSEMKCATLQEIGPFLSREVSERIGTISLLKHAAE